MKALITYAHEDNWYRPGEIYTVVSDGVKYAHVVGHWNHKGKTILLENCELLFNQAEVNEELEKVKAELRKIEANSDHQFEQACKARRELYLARYLLRFISELANKDALPPALEGYSAIRKHYQHVKERGNEADRESLEEVIHYLGADQVVADISPWNAAQLPKRRQ
ncbi:hypothetical protein [Paenibacillus tyrfis]|uniref:hypothetical protein n=1 Tax=Paenibacillus tyrfis TaxID=1501230 RepID=UPI00209E027B|nr:hypothetical protein [Paenibacillus tyrfis]MCP1306443.1 hypothetical protein [Paenibacillus tyrfis]